MTEEQSQTGNIVDTISHAYLPPHISAVCDFQYLSSLCCSSWNSALLNPK